MEDSDPRIGTSIDGRYRLRERLGAGGMGVVYKGEQIGIGKTVAVKFLHETLVGSPELVKRFEREVAAMSRLAHPHLVSIFDAGVAGDVPYLVMDFHTGHPLSTLLERGALPPARAIAIARQVLSGVGHAHANGVVHRDLKPDNILLLDGVAEDFVKVLDFGLAKMLQGSGDEAMQLTNTGFALGTPSHMAPEQVKGGPTDERSDIYAIGTILYQMVVGRKPFVAESPMAVLRMHLEVSPVPPRKAAPDSPIGAALEAAILRALEKDPAGRWPTAEAFSRALEGAVENRGAGAPPVDRPMRPIDDRPTPASEAAIVPSDPGPPRERGSFRQTALLLLVAAMTVGAVMGWSRLSRREQRNMRHKIETVAGEAKGTLRELSEAAERTLAEQEPPHPAENQEPPLVAPAPSPAPSATPASEPRHPEAKDDGDDRDDDSPPPLPLDAPGARLEATSQAAGRPGPSAPRKPPQMKDATGLLARGKVDDAIQVLYQLRRKTPRSPEVALTLGHAYFQKLWRSDGLREYDSAVGWRSSTRRDRTLIRNAVIALDDPTYKPARALIQTRLGAAALGELRRASRGASSPKVQKRAGRLALDLARPARARGRR